ncbi:MAG: phenylalanine--tRNA ligase subunit alpha [Xanthomonadales bacterium]|nr:phenylalanine--tRNA ligase subunit alpha [Gammaproteobacteria bacterium]MBT8050459.1 phenylalanine--tRNA ligase subunit alpha [Gammaproteobacteria bacterium]MBT8055335.1 phenylalanine--tRNA ligase subunit alpha [Gammaproteobacteria bacterium]NNJ78996.1 phenylalanine--tRNA ligase subunit alpha [Xanthomonadales bacterium]NNL05492.1 phenylalanine--tRNA ligase subunit alpha [Xanthomonadales bacterium]
MNTIDELRSRALNEIDASGSLPDLDALRVRYLGKKGEITAQLKTLGQMEPEQRKAFGQAVNAARDAINQSIGARRKQLEAAALEQKLLSEKVDVTLPGRGEQPAGLHPVTMAMERAIGIFTKLGFDVATGPEVEDDHYNFESLNFPPHHPARAMHDTFYFGDGRLLRTHTSPVQIRVMEKGAPPFRIIAPGKVFRSDSDQTHTPMFHQIEGLLVGRNVSMADLKGVLHTFVNAFFERSLAMRFRPSYFPFTEPSAEVDIGWEKGDGSEPGWLEILGCGMVHPNVLRGCGVDSEEFTGYAFGMGVERMAMLRYGVTDLRQFFENDLEFLRQFH